jgi:hypothetical protein
MSTPLERLARRVETDSFFLAAPLARFAESRRLDDPALAAHLGCDPAALPQLRLCRNPDPLPPSYWRDVERIADCFRLDADRLAEVVRLGQALLLARPPDEVPADPAPGYLMAAREGDDDTSPPEKEP